ncbi:ABC transporter C family member 13 [Sesamum angolense]|uniref:ABC transporter C family member 13 n=1 Tax=Sesamum angolense TaxID=2727404 RepID=A0AAE1WLR4_9LAMI|nr:ABC transporter C family member 13 [Sesamum angolense]
MFSDENEILHHSMLSSVSWCGTRMEFQSVLTIYILHFCALMILSSFNKIIGTGNNGGGVQKGQLSFCVLSDILNPQFDIQVAILIVSRCGTWSDVLCSGILCFWWIIKTLLLIPRLEIVFSSPQVVRWIKEICGAITDIIFGILINIMRMKVASYRNSSMVDSLLPYQRETEEGQFRDSESVCRIWRLMTFKTIDPVMQHGVNKQLDFEDLLQLPIDMDPSSCHALLLRMWDAQKGNNLSGASLFKTICSAYGWPYFCIGLLKDSLRVSVGLNFLDGA